MAEETISAREEIEGAISWCHIQAESIMELTTDCRMSADAIALINSTASDIAINLETMAERLACLEVVRKGVGRG